MKKVLKETLSGFLWYSGITALARKCFPAKKLTVLMYHKVKREHFEKQVAYLKKWYTIVSEKEVYDFYYKKKELPRNSVLITFDDGYLNNYTEAYPVLKKYNAPAIIFLTTGFIGKNKMPWYDLVTYLVSKSSKKSLFLDGEEFILSKKGRKNLLTKYYHYMITADEKEFVSLLSDLKKNAGVSIPKKVPKADSFMSWEQAKDMMPLVSFGSHTVNHPIIPNVSKKIIEKELFDSKNILEKKLNSSCKSFCFPNGDFDKESIDIVKKIGYKLSYLTLFGRNSNNKPFHIKRFGININDNKSIFSFKLTKLSNIFTNLKKGNNFRIVMLTNYYFPQKGGITTMVHQLHSSLLKKNIKSTVLPFPHIFRKIENLFKNNSLIHKLFVIIYISYAEIYLILLRILYKKIIVHSHSANFCARAASISRYFGVKSVHTFHTHLDMSPRKRYYLSYLNKIDVLTSVSKSLGDENKKAFGIKKNIKKIFNGVAVIKENKIHIKERIIKLVFVGHLFDIKDPLLFVRTVEELVKQGKKVEAIMIGDGDLRNIVKEYIKKNNLDMIRMLGIISREEVFSFYDWADLFVSTSKGEGLAVVWLEAMAHGTPVVATDSGGSLEAISHKKDGYIVKKRDTKELVKGIEFALENYSFLSRNALYKIENDFNWENLINEYVKIYHRISLERGVENSEE